MKLNKLQESIVDSYVKIANKLGHHPSRSELLAEGISRTRVRSHFGNLSTLKDLVIKKKLVNLPDPDVAKAPRILLVDIETAPILANVWGLWDNNVALNQIQSDWFVLSWSAKWLNESKVMYMDQRKAKKVQDDSKILGCIWKLLDEADIIITQNGKSFDAKKLNARFIINGFQPPSGYRHIDTLTLARKHFGFTSNKLAYMTDKLCTKYKKLEHKKFPGFELWKECIAGNIEAWKEMETYNKHDVLSLEELYKKLSPWDGDINFSVYEDKDVCKCGKSDFVKNGFYYTNSSRYQRYKCKSCGSEARDTKKLNINKLRIGTK